MFDSTRDGHVASERKRKRTSKNRPMETSSKRPAERVWSVVNVPKKERRDPRFEATCGRLDLEKFRKSYGFVYDEVIPKEQSVLQKSLRKERNESKKNRIQASLDRMKQVLKKETELRKEDARQRERKQKEKEAVRQGKKPYFLKKSEIKKQDLELKFKELKKSGKLQDYLAKKRKRRAAKDHKHIPRERRTKTEP